MPDETFGPDQPPDVSATPSGEGGFGYDAPAAPELGAESTEGLGQAAGPAAPQATLESLQAAVKTLEKRFSDTQSALHDKTAEAASLRGQLEATKSRMPIAPIASEQDLGGFGMPVPPEAVLQPSPALTQIGWMAAAIADERIETRMMQAEQALKAEFGIAMSDGEKKAVRDYCNAANSADVKAAIRVVLHDRFLDSAKKQSREATMSEVRKSQQATVPGPTGQPGEPKRDYELGPQGYLAQFTDLKLGGQL